VTLRAARGSIAASDAACLCCGERRGFVYAGPAYCEAELEEALCPWCIAGGSAHAKFDASFADEALFPDGLARETIDEIAFRTPGFNGWQQERWLGCCGDAAAFREAVGHAEIKARYPALEGALMMHIVHDLGLSGGAATRYLQALDREHGPTAYVFSCRHRDNRPFYIDAL